jgi:hypothetical protein
VFFFYFFKNCDNFNIVFFKTQKTLVIKWIEILEINKTAVVDLLLIMKPVRGKVGFFRLGITLVEPLNYLLVNTFL